MQDTTPVKPVIIACNDNFKIKVTYGKIDGLYCVRFMTVPKEECDVPFVVLRTNADSNIRLYKVPQCNMYRGTLNLM